MLQKTALVTGANTGMGRETARELARTGMRVVMTSRDMAKGESAQSEITRDSGNPEVHLMRLDLASQRSIRDFARAYRARYDRLDVLVNNAGVSLVDPAMTEDGIEWTAGVNHFGHFLLTRLLLDLLRSSAPSRIVIVGSSMHAMSRLSLAEYAKGAPPGAKGKWSGSRAYADSKLMNTLFTYELSRRLEGTGVTVTCAQPGLVNSEFFRNYRKIPFMLKVVQRLIGKSPAQGARTAVYLARSPEVEGITGACYENLRPVRTSARSRDTELARLLWEQSEQLTGLR